MNQPASSEEKLLKLIRQKDKAQAASNVSSEKFASGKSTTKEKSKHSVDFFPMINYILIIVVVAVIAYFIKSIFVDRPLNEQIPAIDLSNVKVAQDKDTFTERKPYGFYEQRIAQRNIFLNPWEEATEGELTGEIEDVSAIQRNYTILGVVVDNDPKVILENKITKETVFLSVGEKIGQAILSEVYENKIIFIDGEDKIELSQ